MNDQIARKLAKKRAEEIFYCRKQSKEIKATVSPIISVSVRKLIDLSIVYCAGIAQKFDALSDRNEQDFMESPQSGTNGATLI